MLLGAARQFLLIMGLGLIVAGLTTYVIIGILSVVHVRDKHPALRARLGANIAAPRMIDWFLRARYRAAGDAGLNAIALPGSIGVWAILAGVACIIASTGMGYV
ncbi:hypothetical protein [Dokdonella koreensis]|uniref:Uncharacterized protein n=1 Tax=Dokdonella koreensis DS-123 TaxID=1300342 RepID=A0A160DTD9_9GAMM|nr:hypothetical protein [Dokdonella koreensis]ANB17627.1 Hypothetical protein I596_1603 [Dokdonella koreensis DS-123]